VHKNYVDAEEDNTNQFDEKKNKKSLFNWRNLIYKMESEREGSSDSVHSDDSIDSISLGEEQDIIFAPVEENATKKFFSLPAERICWIVEVEGEMIGF